MSIPNRVSLLLRLALTNAPRDNNSHLSPLPYQLHLRAQNLCCLRNLTRQNHVVLPHVASVMAREPGMKNLLDGDVVDHRLSATSDTGYGVHHRRWQSPEFPVPAHVISQIEDWRANPARLAWDGRRYRSGAYSPPHVDVEIQCPFVSSPMPASEAVPVS